jgi:hypothetical protein
MILVTETDKRFYIADSTIPNAGSGCFTKEYLKKGDWLEVIGVYVEIGSITDECTHYAKRYKFLGSPNMNYKIIPMGYGALVNHSDDDKIRNCQISYMPGLSKRNEHAGQVVYLFTRDIFPGEEIIGNYGTNVGEEIKKLSKNLGFLDNNEIEIEKFLSCDLYNMKNIVERLRQI